jgi:hypothetical protein
MLRIAGPYKLKRKCFRAGGVVELLPSKHNIMSSTPVLPKKKKGKVS